MSTLDISMLVFLGVFAVIGLVWFIYEARSDDEK